MRRILVGVDGSEASLDALAWSADIARRAQVELVVVRVLRDPDGAQRERGEVERWLAAGAGEVPGARVVLVGGDPAAGLLEASRRESAELLVAGGRGAGGFAGLHLGSVAHHLVHHTDVPLAIVPRAGASPVRHLVLGVDGSPGSLAAAERAAELASALSVDVTAVYALEPYLEWVPGTDAQSWQRAAEADAREWASPIEKAGIPLAVEVERDSHPVAVIARAVQAREGSVAVVGTRGRRGFVGLRLGRVPLQLVHQTGTAVVVVPPTTP